MNTLESSAVRPTRTTTHPREPIPAGHLQSVPSGWRRLHKVAVTLDNNHLPDYATEFFRDCFGASACEEDASSDIARKVISELDRPTERCLTAPTLGRILSVDLRLRRNLKPSRRYRSKRRFLEENGGEADDAPGASRWKGSTGPPIETRYTALPGADPWDREEADESGTPLSHEVTQCKPQDRYGGSDRARQVEGPTNRWSFGSCSTEFSFDKKEEYRSPATGDPPWVSRPGYRRPKVSDVISRKREGPLGPDWVKNAYLITTENGVVIQREVKSIQVRERHNLGPPKPVDKNDSGRAKRRYRIVARRLKKGAAGDAAAEEAQSKRLRSARDGPPLKEASP